MDENNICHYHNTKILYTICFETFPERRFLFSLPSVLLIQDETVDGVEQQDALFIVTHFNTNLGHVYI